ncbi:hypothetical protein TNCV_2862061 [Trichonephila clavipes]|nr:hypothetical protein TNCV_2862061 [Trichonephila clavipes]
MGAFRATGNVFKERKGLPKIVRTPENVERVRVSIRTGDVKGFARSPDLSPPDSFLWTYSNPWFCKDRSNTLENLRNHIRDEIYNIQVNVLEKAA